MQVEPLGYFFSWRLAQNFTKVVGHGAWDMIEKENPLGDSMNFVYKPRNRV